MLPSLLYTAFCGNEHSGTPLFLNSQAYSVMLVKQSTATIPDGAMPFSTHIMIASVISCLASATPGVEYQAPFTIDWRAGEGKNHGAPEDDAAQ